MLWDWHAATIATWFHTNITCQFGRPVVICNDRGTEFHGVFHSYLRRLGVYHALILSQHTQANGLVERVKSVILQGIRRLLQEVPDKDMKEDLPDVLAGLRFLPHNLGHWPFIAVFK